VEVAGCLDEHETQPPGWPLRLLQRLGGYVFSSGRPFQPRHRLDPCGPITGTPDCRLTAWRSPQIRNCRSSTARHGTPRFLTIVGITSDELTRMTASSANQVLDEIATTSPLLITDPRR